MLCMQVRSNMSRKETTQDVPSKDCNRRPVKKSKRKKLKINVFVLGSREIEAELSFGKRKQLYAEKESMKISEL